MTNKSLIELFSPQVELQNKNTRNLNKMIIFPLEVPIPGSWILGFRIILQSHQSKDFYYWYRNQIKTSFFLDDLSLWMENLNLLLRNHVT